jgi:hypothetical protein
VAGRLNRIETHTATRIEANSRLAFISFLLLVNSNDNYVAHLFDASKPKAGRRPGLLFELRDFPEFKGVPAAP